MEYKDQLIDDTRMFRAATDWVMNQQDADEMQVHPSFPLLFGVDGRFSGGLRRFRGFKRLDYDTRYPHSNVGQGEQPVIHHGVVGAGPNYMSGGMSLVKNYVPHNWACKGVQSIDPESSTLYQFVAGTLDRARRSEGASDRRPLSVFLVHFLDPDGKPCIKLMGRPIGDASLSALFQSNLIGAQITGIPGSTSPRPLDLRLKETVGTTIDWVGLGLVGRFVVLSHKGGHTETKSPAGNTWVYESPFKAYRGIIKDSNPTPAPRHTLDLPETEFPSVDNGFMQKGDRYLRCKQAGTRGWNWLHQPPYDATNKKTTILNFEATTQDTWTTGGAYSHVAAVLPPDDENTTYIVSQGTGAIQKYKLRAPGSPTAILSTDTVLAVSLRVRAARGSAGTRIIKIQVVIAGVGGDYFEYDIGLHGTYFDLPLPHLKRPGGGQWTPADLNNTEVWLWDGGAGQVVQVTTLGLTVVHFPAPSVDVLRESFNFQSTLLDNWTPGGAYTRVVAVAPPDDENTTYIISPGTGAVQKYQLRVSSAIPIIPRGATILTVSLIVRAARAAPGSPRLINYQVYLGGNPGQVFTWNVGGSGIYLNLGVVDIPRPGGGSWQWNDLNSIEVWLWDDGNPAQVTTLELFVTYLYPRAEDGSLMYLGSVPNSVPHNITPHTPLNLFKARVRLVNYTTGMVGPMGKPLRLEVGPNGEGAKVSWVPGTQYTAVVPGAVAYTAVEKDRALFRSVFGADLVVGSEGAKALTGLHDATIIEREGLYDIRLQVWVTQSVPIDNPSGGGGYYYLDQEIPVVYRRAPFTDPVTSAADGILICPGWLGDASLGSKHLGKSIPSQSNDALISQPLYVPEADDVGELEPSEAFGSATGSLLSLSDGGALSNAPGNASSGDIKASPPWKSYPGGWIETTAPLFRHPIFPKGLVPPRFVNVGDFLFFVNQNRVVRIVRDGVSLLVDDVDISGGVSVFGACGLGRSLLLVTSTGLEEVNPVTLDVTLISAVQRIIADRWQSYVQEGRIISGYDPQLKAVFICPRRPLTSTAWFRSEALVIWTTTGRITMLSDVYWCAMSRGVHPVTGREHLFFIDPAHNITYADDSLDDTRPATMMGISPAVDPSFPTTGFQRNQAVWTITVSATTFGSTDTIVVDGIPFQKGISGSWTDSSGTTTGIATSIRDTIESWRVAYPGFNVSSVTVLTNVVTITTKRTGSINDEFTFVSLLNVTSGLVVARTTAGESATGPAKIAGSGFQGTVTGISGTTTKTITDSTMNATDAGINFDLYAWYNPHDVGGAGVQPTLPALVGSQVYLFRLVTNDLGESRPALVADVRIKSNTQQTFAYNESEVTYHNGATSVLSGDHYCISPVVFQAVSAPLDAGGFPGSGLDSSGSVETLGLYLRNRRGTAKVGGARLPSTNPMQGSLFIGLASKEDLLNRSIGNVVSPSVEVGVNSRIENTDGSAGDLIWDEASMDIVTARIGKSGNALFPVITCFGADYLFDLNHIQGRISKMGSASGTRPEGVL